MSDCSGLSTVSLVVLVIGIVCIVGTAIHWVIVFYRYKKGQKKENPKSLPRFNNPIVQESGEYVDFQDSSNRYEPIENMKSDNKPFSKYFPKRDKTDVMEETFDGSRMPKTNAPKPPTGAPPRRNIFRKSKIKSQVGSADDVYEECEATPTNSIYKNTIYNQ